MRKQGILAMEDLDEVVEEQREEVVEPSEDELAGTAPEAEAMSDVEAAHDEVVETDDAVEEASETADTIEQVRENVEEAAETEGGVSEPEARALDVAVEHMLVQLGLPRAKAKVFPAMEGFKEKSTRLQATRVALESISDKLKTLWQAIITNIQKVWEAVVAFVKSVLAGAKHLEVRAGIIKKLAARKKDAKVGEVKVKPSFAMIAKEGKVLEGAALVAGINELGKDGIINFDYGHAATVANTCLSAVLDGLGKEGAGSNAEKHLAELSKELLLPFGDSKEFALPLGGAVLHVEVQKGDSFATGASVELKPGEAKLPETVEGMSAEDAAKVADAVLANLKKFGAYEKQSGDIAAAMKSLTAKMKSAMAKAPGDDAEGQSKAEGIKTAHEVAKAIQVTKTLLARTSTLVRGYDLRTCKAALDYAGASVGAAGKEAKEPKEAATAAA